MIQFHALGHVAATPSSLPSCSVAMPMSPSLPRSESRSASVAWNERTADLMWSSSAIRRCSVAVLLVALVALLPGSLLRSPFWLEDRRMNSLGGVSYGDRGGEREREIRRRRAFLFCLVEERRLQKKRKLTRRRHAISPVCRFDCNAPRTRYITGRLIRRNE